MEMIVLLSNKILVEYMKSIELNDTIKLKITVKNKFSIIYHLVWLVLQREKVQLHDPAPHLDSIMDHPAQKCPHTTINVIVLVRILI